MAACAPSQKAAKILFHISIVSLYMNEGFWDYFKELFPMIMDFFWKFCKF